MKEVIINKVLNLTHDKFHDSWVKLNNGEVHLEDRKNFEQYLSEFIDKQPSIETDLEVMLEYVDKNDVLLLKRGLMNILKGSYPKIHEEIITRQFSKYVKKKIGKPSERLRK